MIQRSGFIALSLSPISRATARTRSTFALSSVSGMVKNCGAWGNIAPPMTVETMALLLDPHLARSDVGWAKAAEASHSSARSTFRRAHAVIPRQSVGMAEPARYITGSLAVAFAHP